MRNHVEKKHSKNRDVTEIKRSNLIPFVKGQSGNPKGKPKGSKNMSTIIREMLDTLVDIKDKDGRKLGKKMYKNVIVAKLLQRATTGDLRAIEMLLDRVEGKPTQKIDNINPQTPTINVNLIKPE